MIKNKKYYIITAIITGIGLFLIIIGGLIGGLKIHSEAYGTFQRSYNVDNPQSLFINLDMGKLTINKNQTGSGKIEVFGNNVSENNLIMSETPMGNCRFEYHQSKYYRFSMMSFGKYYVTPKGIYEYETPSITISVPESVKKLGVSTNYGDVKIYDISADNINLELDLGDLYVDNINTRTFEADVNLGDTDFNGITADLFEIEMDAGDANIENATIKNLDASINVGNFEFGGLITAYGEIEMDAGDVDIAFADDLQKYALNVNTDFGELKILGQQYGTPYRPFGSGGMSGLIPFTIESDVGDVNIN
ncbi:MAG: DUF4097 domain-containing protein [Ruminococcus sp.]|jgi:hypothetical protein|nr:DUF4097 domain-containing protein [Ruminococcus sp.]